MIIWSYLLYFILNACQEQSDTYIIKHYDRSALSFKTFTRVDKFSRWKVLHSHIFCPTTTRRDYQVLCIEDRHRRSLSLHDDSKYVSQSVRETVTDPSEIELREWRGDEWETLQNASSYVPKIDLHKRDWSIWKVITVSRRLPEEVLKYNSSI